MNDIDKFLDKLHKISNELDVLGREFSDLYKKYDGNDFDKQNYLSANKLDNAMHQVTHETATSISFMTADIKMLTDFITFRKTFSELTDVELENIIENSIIPLVLKLELANKLTNGDAKLILEKIKNIKQSWEKVFGNITYNRISNTIYQNL